MPTPKRLTQQFNSPAVRIVASAFHTHQELLHLSHLKNRVLSKDPENLELGFETFTAYSLLDGQIGIHKPADAGVSEVAAFRALGGRMENSHRSQGRWTAQW